MQNISDGSRTVEENTEMTDKGLRWMSRADLIEIIYELRKNEAALQKENAELKQKLNERQQIFARAGSLAELSARVNGLFEAAQATADQYLTELQIKSQGSRQRTPTMQKPAPAVQKSVVPVQKSAPTQRKAPKTSPVPQRVPVPTKELSDWELEALIDSLLEDEL